MSGNVATVTNPRTEGEGRSKHTLYLVRVKAGETDGSGTATEESNVRRRYSDFQWLYSRLIIEKPGAFVPIIPHKAAPTPNMRFSETLIEERRGRLETFLGRVVFHPELSNSPSFITFLRADDTAFEIAKRESGTKINESELESSDDSSMVSEPSARRLGDKARNVITRAAAVVSAATGGASGTELQKRPDDPQYEDVLEYITDLEVHVKALAKRATILVKGVKDNSDGMQEMSDKFAGLKVTHPASAGFAVFNVLLASLSDTAKVLHGIGHDKFITESISFDDSMQDLSRKVHAAKLALKLRKEKQVTYTTRVQQIKNRTAALDKLKGKAGKEDKIPQAECDLEAAEKANDLARDDLDDTTKRLLREIDRFKTDFSNHVQQVMMDYARTQIQYNNKVADEWSKLVPNLDSKPPMPGNPPPEVPKDEAETTPAVQFM